jgi:hypothetical protein
MTEKRVSVRLAVVGGREVRAELGRGGRHPRLRPARPRDGGGEHAPRRLLRPGEGRGAAAIAAAAASGIAMVRSGLATVDAQAKLAQSLDTTVASIQVPSSSKSWPATAARSAAGTKSAMAALMRPNRSSSGSASSSVAESLSRPSAFAAGPAPAAATAEPAGQVHRRLLDARHRHAGEFACPRPGPARLRRPADRPGGPDRLRSNLSRVS